MPQVLFNNKSFFSFHSAYIVGLYVQEVSMKNMRLFASYLLSGPQKNLLFINLLIVLVFDVSRAYKLI